MASLTLQQQSWVVVPETVWLSKLKTYYLVHYRKSLATVINRISWGPLSLGLKRTSSFPFFSLRSQVMWNKSSSPAQRPRRWEAQQVFLLQPSAQLNQDHDGVQGNQQQNHPAELPSWKTIERCYRWHRWVWVVCYATIGSPFLILVPLQSSAMPQLRASEWHRRAQSWEADTQRRAGKKGGRRSEKTVDKKWGDIHRRKEKQQEEKCQLNGWRIVDPVWIMWRAMEKAGLDTWGKASGGDF